MIRAAAVAAAAAAGAYALLVEPRRLVVRRYEVPAPGLAGLRIGVMTDLHAGVVHASRTAVAKWVAAVNAEEPDLVLLGGDFTDAHPIFGGRMRPDEIARFLAELRAPLGVVAVLGNHDWKRFGAEMMLALKGAGITVLENESVRVGGFHVAGVADLRMRRPSVTQALRDVPEGEPVIVLAHDPDVFPYVPGRVALTVSGHTHGGQIAIPYVRQPAVPSGYGERFVRGHIVEDGRHLIVSAGLGTSGLPIRFLAPPEIVVIEMRG